MALFCQEIKKSIIKNRIIMLLVIILCARACYIIYYQNANMYVDSGIERNKDCYMDILEILHGGWTDDKQRIYDGMENRLKKQGEDIGNYGIELLNGKITEDDYWNLLKRYSGFGIIQDQLNMIENQVSYITDNPKNRYFMYENGWNDYFGNIGMDYFLIFLLIVGIVRIFCREYETDMYRINRTTVCGDGISFGTKFAVGMLYALVSAVLFCFEDIILSDIRYGLYDIDYPLASLSIFKDIQWDVNIGTALIISILIRILGAVYFSVLIMVVSILFRRTLNSVVCALAIGVLPVYAFSDGIICSIPWPASFMSAHGLILGWHNWGEDTVSYSLSDILIKSGTAVVIMIICMLMVYFIYCHKMIPFRRILGGASAIMMAVGLSSCGTDEGITSTCNFDYISCGEMLIAEDGTVVDSHVNPCLYVSDDETRDLFMDPFMSENELALIKLLHIEGDIMYYLATNDNDEYKLCSMDIHSGEINILYEHYISSASGTDYLGIMKNKRQPGIDYVLEKNIDRGFVNGRYYYYMQRDNLICCNLDTGKTEVIIKNIYSFSGAAGNNILYVNGEDMDIWIYDTVNGNNQKVISDCCLSVKSIGDNFYYQNGKGELLLVHTDLCKAERIMSGIEGTMVYMDDRYMYSLENETVINVYGYSSGELIDSVDFEYVITAVTADRSKGKIYYNYIAEDGEEQFASIRVNL